MAKALTAPNISHLSRSLPSPSPKGFPEPPPLPLPELRPPLLFVLLGVNMPKLQSLLLAAGADLSVGFGELVLLLLLLVLWDEADAEASADLPASPPAAGALSLKYFSNPLGAFSHITRQSVSSDWTEIFRVACWM